MLRAYVRPSNEQLQRSTDSIAETAWAGYLTECMHNGKPLSYEEWERYCFDVIDTIDYWELGYFCGEDVDIYEEQNITPGSAISEAILQTYYGPASENMAARKRTDYEQMRARLDAAPAEEHRLMLRTEKRRILGQEDPPDDVTS